jgi:hypothetical protein
MTAASSACGELTPNSSSYLRYLLGGAEPVEPRHQRGVEARGDGQGRGRNCRGGPPPFALALHLQYCFGHLLHKQRNAVGALHDLRHHIRRQLLVADKVRDDGRRITLSEAVERHARNMRPSSPRRVELGAESDDEQHWKSFNSVHRPTKYFQSGRIDPMRIFYDH